MDARNYDDPNNEALKYRMLSDFYKYLPSEDHARGEGPV